MTVTARHWERIQPRECEGVEGKTLSASSLHSHKVGFHGFVYCPLLAIIQQLAENGHPEGVSSHLNEGAQILVTTRQREYHKWLGERETQSSLRGPGRMANIKGASGKPM